MMLTRNKFNKTFLHVYKFNKLVTIMTDYDVTMNCCLEGKKLINPSAFIYNNFDKTSMLLVPYYSCFILHVEQIIEFMGA